VSGGMAQVGRLETDLLVRRARPICTVASLAARPADLSSLGSAGSPELERRDAEDAGQGIGPVYIRAVSKTGVSPHALASATASRKARKVAHLDSQCKCIT
jgi:hypothetical protein